MTVPKLKLRTERLRVLYSDSIPNWASENKCKVVIHKRNQNQDSIEQN